MSKQMLVIVGALAATFFAGIAIGFFLASDPSRSSVIAKNAGLGSTSSFFADSEAQDREQSNTLLSNRIRELENDLAEQKENDRKQYMAEQIAFFQKYQSHVRLVSFYDESLQINPAMIAILGLTKDEQSAVEAHLKQIQKEMQELTDSNTVVAKQSANSITYNIPADAKGFNLETKLAGLISKDIGGTRAGFFMDKSDFDNFYSGFSGFGAQNGEITINWTDQGGKKMYTYKQTDGGRSRWADTPQADLPIQLQKYLPEGMKP